MTRPELSQISLGTSNSSTTAKRHARHHHHILRQQSIVKRIESDYSVAIDKEAAIADAYAEVGVRWTGGGGWGGGGESIGFKIWEEDAGKWEYARDQEGYAQGCSSCTCRGVVAKGGG